MLPRAGKMAHFSLDMRLLMQDEIQQRTVDLDAAVVVNEAKFSKLVHEKAHARPGRSDHLRKRLLADFRDHRLRFVFLAKVRQQQEQTARRFSLELNN